MALARIRSVTCWLRLVLALLWTTAILPLLHAYFFNVLMYVGPSPFFLVLNLVGIIILGLLTRGIGAGPPLDRWRGPILIAAALGWFIGTTLVVANMLEPTAPFAALVAVGGLASLWQPWLGWMYAWPQSHRTRFALAAVLLGLSAIFPLLFRTEGITGADAFIVGWRQTAQPPPSAAWSASLSHRAPAPELGPHPDFPQFMGPERNGVIPNPPALARSWSQQPPEVLWRRPVGPAWSSFAVVGKRAVTQEQRGIDEAVVAYDLATGRQLWIHAYRAEMAPSMGGPGPRATPTIDRGRVYAVGATGILSCLALESGTPHWTVDILADNLARPDDNGVSGSPLIAGDLVVAAPTGSKEVPLAAYDRLTGRRRWQARGEPASYSSPILASIRGQEQIVYLNGSGLSGYSPDSGRRLWHSPFNPNGNNCSQPIVLAGSPERIFVSSDRSGCALVELNGNSESGIAPRQLWQKPFFRVKFSTPVLFSDAAVGLDMGILARLSLAEGDLVWKQGRYQFGQILRVGALLLVLAEDGTLILVDPAERGPVELGRFRALEGKTWNHLALAGELLLVRNSQEAACLRLPLDSSTETARHDPSDAR